MAGTREQGRSDDCAEVCPETADFSDEGERPPLQAGQHDDFREGDALRQLLVEEEEEFGRNRFQVYLHVYNLGPITGTLNELLMSANLGAFHTGIEVLGEEWSFQGFHDAFDNPSISGVVRNEPRQHPAYDYRESVSLGESPLDEVAIDSILDLMMDQWTASQYHLVRRNCVTFAEELAMALQVPEPFPAWTRGAIDAGKSAALLPVADYGWSWFKWYCIRCAEQEESANAAKEAESERGESR
eukprot:TRINITY_DN115570_c0_g1_i1.p1 TRINITY_DN115570_c0_g1~~TRINITY_DN115570_c0_g1_i1.p1  ORF type:complete len:243 (-),score=53.11 TRINITY_DN115570_c0_g1_i1:55-783(-)